MGRNSEAYYYFRSGFLHETRKVRTDSAVRLSADEDRRLREAVAASPGRKAEILRDFWVFMTETKGDKPFDFASYMDRVCEEKRKSGGGR